MSRQTFNESKAVLTSDATAVGNSTTETIIVPDYTFPAGEFNTGVLYRAKLYGVISNVVTATPTITFRVRIGTTTLSATWVSASGALVCNATANTNLTWHAEFQLVCRTAGTAGTGFLSGQIWLPNLTAATTINTEGYNNLIPASAPAAGTLNTTVANLMSVSAQWSAANAANTITTNQFLLECLT